MNIDINEPGIYAINGTNGAGKTTLINSIIGINNLGLSGDLLFNDISSSCIDLYNLRKKNISIMIQGERLPSISVKEYILNYIVEDDFYKKLNQDIFKELFISEFFNIHDVFYKNISNLSSGQKQMVLMLVVLFKDADIYILDEPTSNIHNDLRRIVEKTLIYFKKNKKIMLIISHDKDMEKIFDKCFDLNKL